MFSRLCKKLWSKHEDRPLVHSSSVQGQSFTGLSVGSRDRDPNVNRLRRKCIFQRAAATHQTIDRERCQISEWEAADGVSDAAVLSSANWESKILICEPRKRSSRSDQDLSSSSPPSSEAKVTEEDSVGGTPRRQGYDHSALRWASRPQKRQTIAVRRGQRPLLLDLSSHLPRCTERSKPKEEDLAWSVDDLSHLPETLRHLLVNGYTACEIGKVMETILHGRDGFMGGNITALIDMQASYAEIGRAVIQYWRRRTGDDVLLTLKVKPGNMSMRPTHPSLFPQQSTVRRKPLPKKDANRNPPSANRPFVQLPSYSSHEAANNVHILQHHEKLPAANAVGLKLCHGNLPLRPAGSTMSSRRNSKASRKSVPPPKRCKRRSNITCTLDTRRTRHKDT